MRQMPFHYKEHLPQQRASRIVKLCVPQNYVFESEALKESIFYILQALVTGNCKIQQSQPATRSM